MAKIQLNGKKIIIKSNLSILDLLKKYKLNKKIAFYIYQELYFLLNPSERYFYDKTRFGTGIQYELNKNTDLEIKYLKINDINIENPSSLNILGLKISHQF